MATPAGTEPPERPVQRAEDLLQILQLAYDVGVRALAAQEASVSGVRNNAGAVATLNGLVATFLGRRALEGHHVTFGLSWMSVSIPEWCALVALLASVACVMQILRPRAGWVFHFSPTGIVDQFAFGPKATTLPVTYKMLARFSQENLAKNRVLLAKLYRWLVAAIVLLFVQVVCWLVAAA
jgi:hypothetical protein